jgi:hypothetical protein
MSRLQFITLLFLSCTGLFLTGCQRDFDGDLEFRNKSPRELWVTVAGFSYEPPVGVLVPGGVNSSDLGRIELPQQVTLTWRYVGEPDTTTILSLTNLPPNMSGGTIVFEFTKTNAWIITYESK